MAVLLFELSPQHCARLNDALNCLAKFSDIVCIEARYSQLLLSALNSSHSAYAVFDLRKNEFFKSYDFDKDAQLREERFTCSLLNRSLASVFRGRLGDSKAGDNGIERCEAVFEAGGIGEESRLVFKLVYPQGISKTFRLNYETAEMMQAVFDHTRARNCWKAPARMLRELSEFFGSKTEQLDMCLEAEQVTLTSYTEKIMHGKETLKQPLHTAITVDTSDFEEFDVQEDQHVAISIKEFRSIITHADTLKAVVRATYAGPGQPLQFSYTGEGLRCEYTLMTVGDLRGATPAAPKKAAREPRSRPVNDSTAAAAATEAGMSARDGQLRQPQETQRPTQQGRLGRRLPSQPSLNTHGGPEADGDSLFVPAANDDDAQWQPVEERGDLLGWDASANNNASMHPTFRDGVSNDAAAEVPAEAGILPTQRASDFRGLFD